MFEDDRVNNRLLMITLKFFHTIRVMTGVHGAPLYAPLGNKRCGRATTICGPGEDRAVGSHAYKWYWEMSTEINDAYMGHWINEHRKCRRIYVTLCHDDLKSIWFLNRQVLESCYEVWIFFYLQIRSQPSSMYSLNATATIFHISSVHIFIHMLIQGRIYERQFEFGPQILKVPIGNKFISVILWDRIYKYVTLDTSAGIVVTTK